MWYQNICSASFSFVTIHACDGRTDEQNYDSLDCRSIDARAVKTTEQLSRQTVIIVVVVVVMVYLLKLIQHRDWKVS